MTPEEHAKAALRKYPLPNEIDMQDAITQAVEEAVEDERQLWEAAVAEVRAWYPKDVFLPDNIGALARVTCDNIIEAVKQMRGE